MSIESSTHCSEDAEGRERTIAELEDRIRVLEDELRLKHGPAEDSLQLMRYILDQAQDEASLAGPDGRFYYVNDAKCRSLGYTREELLSMHVWDVDSDLTEEKWASVWRDIRDHGFKMFETWHRTKHGQLFRTEVSATHFDFHGREYLCAFVRDITERRRAEDALLESEEKYRELVENANSAILRFDMQGNLTFFNEYAERLFGYSKDEVLGRNVLGTIVPPTESTGRNLKAIIEDIKRHPERYRSNVNENVCKNGDRVWIAWTNKAIRDEQGNVVGVLSVGNDITDRKRMEDALCVSEERLGRACSAGRIGLYEWNVDRGLIYFNPEASELYGCEPGSPVTYEEWLPRVHPEDRGMVERRFAEDRENARRKSGLISQIEFRVVHSDGAVLWLEVPSTYALEGGDLIVRGAVRDITERKRAEDALKLTQASIDLAANEIMWITPEGKIVYANEAACRALQRSRDELLGMYVWDLHTKYTRETWQEHWLEIKERGSFTFEAIHYAKGGREFPVEVSVNYVKSDGKEFNFAYIKDITERKRAEEALRESEERLRRASRAGGVGLYEWNVDRDHIYFSPETYELYGLEPGSPTTYETWLATVHHEDREMVERTIAETREKARNISGISAQLEYRILHPDGAVIWLLATATCNIEDGDLMVRGAVRDITERKLAEMALQEKQETLEVMAEELEVQNEELRTSYEELQIITESLEESERNLTRAQAISHIGNWHIDPATEMGSGSDEFFRILGIPRRKKLHYSEFIELVHPDDRPMARAHFEEVKRTHQQKSFDFRIIRPDGEERDIFLDGEFAFDGEGRPGMFGTMQDITERKRAEEALANAKAQAELYVDLMGHDINNFNLVARGYLELMDGMVEDENLKEIIAKPLEAIDSSSRLIRNVQKLQRAKSGEPRVEVLDLGALVREVAGHFKSLSGDMSVNIACDAVKGVRVRANELLRDVFVNLIGNAIKHSAVPAYIAIRMATGEKDGRGHCKVTIDDNGPGVPDDMKEKIFGRLSRGNTRAKGSGLGLYLVKSLVESYGGRVWVEDRTKGDHTQGARFVVELPVV